MKKKPTYYDLSLTQSLLMYNQSFSIHKQINNIFSLMLMDKELDFDILRQAINIGYEHCDTMRLRLRRVKMKMKQYFLESDPPRIGLLDFTGQTQAEMDRELYCLAAVPLRLTNRSLSRIFIVRSWNGQQGIYLGVSHLAMDSWAICVWFDYIMNVYDSLKNGKAMPPPFRPNEPLLVKDLEYIGSPQNQKDREFWQEECKRPEPFFTHVLGSFWLENYRRKKHNPNLRSGVTFILNTHAAHEILMVPAAQVARMDDFCRSHMIPMQALFMMGVRTVLSARNGRAADITFGNAVARRGTLNEKQSGGSKVNMLMIRTILPEECTFLEALPQITDRQSLLFKHAQFSVMETYKLLQNAYANGNSMATYYSILLTFQPIPLVLKDGTILKTKWYGNGISAQPFYLTVMDGDGTGALRCYYEYQTKILKPAEVQQFHNDLLKVIMAGIEKESITIGELLNLAAPAV